MTSYGLSVCPRADATVSAIDSAAWYAGMTIEKLGTGPRSNGASAAGAISRLIVRCGCDALPSAGRRDVRAAEYGVALGCTRARKLPHSGDPAAQKAQPDRNVRRAPVAAERQERVACGFTPEGSCANKRRTEPTAVRAAPEHRVFEELAAAETECDLAQVAKSRAVARDDVAEAAPRRVPQ